MKRMECCFLTVLAIILLALPAVAAELPPGRAPAGTGEGILAAADWLAAEQCAGGGWRWLTSESCPDTYNHLTGPIALGLLAAWPVTGEPGHLAAALAGGDYDLAFAYPNGEARFASFTPFFLHTLSQVSGQGAYSAHAQGEFFGELAAATYGPGDLDTAGWIAALQADYSGSWINFRPWQLSTLAWTAGEIGNPGQEDLFRAAILDGLATLDAGDPDTVYLDLLGLAGGVHGLALDGVTSFPDLSAPGFPAIDEISTLADLAEVLADFQNFDGSWYRHSSLPAPGPSDEDTQTTAYAVLALAATDSLVAADFSEPISRAKEWLLSMQESGGGFQEYPGSGNMFFEDDGEALQALAGGYAGLCMVPDASCYSPGGTLTVSLRISDAVPPVIGGQFFLAYHNAALDFLAAQPGDPPFTLEIYEAVSEAAGTIDYAASVPPSGGGVTGDATLARLSFQVLASGCEIDGLLTYREHSPPTRLSDESGNAVMPELAVLGPVDVDGSPPEIACPVAANVECDEPSDPGQTGWTTATDDCDPSPAITWSDTHVPGSCPQERTITRTWRATDACGNVSTCPQTIQVQDTTPPVITSCPPDVTVYADAGGCTAAYSWTGITATDNCDPAVSYYYFPPNGSVFQVGTTQVLCYAVDDCGNHSHCVFHVTVVGQTELQLGLELQPLVVPGALTRCITFELWDCDTSAQVTVEEEITFTNGRALGATLPVPCGGWDCITARDGLHTLRRTLSPLAISGTRYVADFYTPGKRLLGGNLNDDAWVDILDYGVFYWQWNTIYGPGSTDCLTPYPHADINGSGIVQIEDFSFIQINFMESAEPGCCGGFETDALPPPVLAISVEELRRRGMAELAVADLTGDGVLDIADMEAFLAGAAPELQAKEKQAGGPPPEGGDDAP